MNQVKHLRTQVNGIDVFYREAGPKGAPVILLPHGYPCSSYEFRNLMLKLADRWRVLAPDFPGCGYSGTPEEFAYDFDGYAAFLAAFAKALHAERFALYLHDFGTGLDFDWRCASRSESPRSSFRTETSTKTNSGRSMKL